MCTLLLTGQDYLFLSYDQAIQMTQSLLYSPGKRIYKKISNRQSGAGSYDQFGMANTIQTLAYKEQANGTNICYTKNFDMGGFTFVFTDNFVSAVC